MCHITTNSYINIKNHFCRSIEECRSRTCSEKTFSKVMRTFFSTTTAIKISSSTRILCVCLVCVRMSKQRSKKLLHVTKHAMETLEKRQKTLTITDFCNLFTEHISYKIENTTLKECTINMREKMDWGREEKSKWCGVCAFFPQHSVWCFWAENDLKWADDDDDLLRSVSQMRAHARTYVAHTHGLYVCIYVRTTTMNDKFSNDNSPIKMHTYVDWK